MNAQAGAVMAPPPPKHLDEMGLSPIFMRDIALKTLFRKNANTVTLMAESLCLPVPITQELIDLARSQGLVEAMGNLTAHGISSEMPYQLTDAGKTRALDALAQSEYYGAMPVPLAAYAAQVERQSIRNTRVTRDRLEAAFGHLVLPERLIADLGPAISAGRSILMYGPPGNGKSSIAAAVREVLGDRIYVPRAVEYAGQVITLYDPVVHSAAQSDADAPGSLRTRSRFDRRYVMCQRPTVATGGELSLDMLDLVYDATARTYQAPLQLKSTGGIFIVDDLGRQADPPQKLVNRWIVPLEEGRDILALRSGEKFEVPFDTLVIFSTNFHPNEIFDQAALRRIFFKLKIDGPDQQDFLKIFAMEARRKHLTLCEESLVHLLKSKYPGIGNVYASYQPGFLIDQILAICDFEGAPYRMTPELVDRAWDNMFVQDEEILC